jgi:5-formyltetrahydrofolate cyclo-ligase
MRKSQAKATSRPPPNASPFKAATVGFWSRASRPTTVAAYASFGTEPGTGSLLLQLRLRGHRVLLPVQLANRDLDWVSLGDADAARLGVDAIRDAQVVVCPGLAADHTGVRLGRGGGSYDRALARSAEGALRCVLLYDDEVLAQVPRDDHDQLIDVIVTPRRVLRRR